MGQARGPLDGMGEARGLGVGGLHGKEGRTQPVQHAEDRRAGRDAHDDGDHQRPDVPSAEPRQHAVAAIAGLRHAVAEQEPADDAAEDRVAVRKLQRGERSMTPSASAPKFTSIAVPSAVSHIQRRP
jgi:hypothetical protein